MAYTIVAMGSSCSVMDSVSELPRVCMINLRRGICSGEILPAGLDREVHGLCPLPWPTFEMGVEIHHSSTAIFSRDIVLSGGAVSDVGEEKNLAAIRCWPANDELAW
jgi:hypothetical protein